jgi:hypothetical protein
VTLRAIDNATGKNVVRQFSTYQNCENWLASDATAGQYEVLDIAQTDVPTF